MGQPPATAPQERLCHGYRDPLRTVPQPGHGTGKRPGGRAVAAAGALWWEARGRPVSGTRPWRPRPAVRTAPPQRRIRRSPATPAPAFALSASQSHSAPSALPLVRTLVLPGPHDAGGRSRRSPAYDTVWSRRVADQV